MVEKTEKTEKIEEARPTVGENDALGRAVAAEHTILQVTVGSTLHGLALGGTDDRDEMGVAVEPPELALGSRRFEHWVYRTQPEGMRSGPGDLDLSVYALHKYARLVLGGNPTMMLPLYAPDADCVLLTPLGRELRAHAALFASRKVGERFLGYLRAQKERLLGERGQMRVNRPELIEAHGFDCHQESETEFLTEQGWKRFDEVSPGERVATVSPSTGQMEFQLPLRRLDAVYSGPLYVIEPFLTRAVITPNHRMLVSPCHRNPKTKFSTRYDSTSASWSLRPLQDLLADRRSHFHIRRAPSYRMEDLLGVDDEYLALMGVYLSEGSTSFVNGKVKSINIHQTTPGLFFQTMSRLMGSYALRRYDYAKETIWVLHGAVARSVHEDCGHKKAKSLPAWCLRLSTRQAELLWDHLIQGDGTERVKQAVYYTSCKGLADSLQAVMVAAGLPCTVNGPYLSHTTYGDVWMYQVIRSKTSEAFHALVLSRRHKFLAAGQSRRGRDGYPVKELLVKNERIVCFEVPNGTLITRSKGKVAVQGNSKYAGHVIRLGYQGVEFLETGRLSLPMQDPVRSYILAVRRGEVSLDEVKRRAVELEEKIEQMLEETKLPREPDYDKANRLVADLYLRHWREKGLA